jgi:hypothetical protein
MRIMKDFEEMTEEDKEEFLKQIQNISDDDNIKDGGDSFDLFTHSFKELSKTWSDSLKEFDTLHPDYLKDEDTNTLEKYESKWTEKIRKKIF